MTWTRSHQPTREQRIEARAARNAAQAETCMERPRSVMGGSTAGPVPAARQKVPGKVRQTIRDSAKGEECTVRLACWGDVIWSHARWGHAGRGKGTKALDLCGAYACVGCDQVFDGQRQRPAGMTQEQVDLAWLHGHMRSLVRLAQKGLL